MTQAASTCCFCGEPTRADATCVANCWRSRLYCTRCASPLGLDGECLGACARMVEPARHAIPELPPDGERIALQRTAISLALPLLYETRETLVGVFAVDGEISDRDHPDAAELVREHNIAIDYCSRALMEGMLL